MNRPLRKPGCDHSGAGAERPDVGRDIGVRAHGVDDDRDDNVFTRVAKDVESEFVIGSAPLAEIDGVAGGQVEDLQIVGRGFGGGFLGLRHPRRLRFYFARRDIRGTRNHIWTPQRLNEGIARALRFEGGFLLRGEGAGQFALVDLVARWIDRFRGRGPRARLR